MQASIILGYTWLFNNTTQFPLSLGQNRLTYSRPIMTLRLASREISLCESYSIMKQCLQGMTEETQSPTQGMPLDPCSFTMYFLNV